MTTAERPIAWVPADHLLPLAGGAEGGALRATTGSFVAQSGMVAVYADTGDPVDPQPPFPEWDPPPATMSPPSIDWLEPASIAVDTETKVTIHGSNFSRPVVVHVDEAVFPAVLVNGSTVTFMAVASAAGVQDIAVESASVTSNSVQLQVI
jgi:IPT/TIG domain